jgi:hypothetical protein
MRKTNRELNAARSMTTPGSIRPGLTNAARNFLLGAPALRHTLGNDKSHQLLANKPLCGLLQRMNESLVGNFHYLDGGVTQADQARSVQQFHAGKQANNARVPGKSNLFAAAYGKVSAFFGRTAARGA